MLQAEQAGKQAAAASLALLGAPEGSCHEAAQLQAVYQCIPALAQSACRLSSGQSHQALVHLQVCARPRWSIQDRLGCEEAGSACQHHCDMQYVAARGCGT